MPKTAWSMDRIWQQLWERIDFDDDDPERCWEWQGARNKKGYGMCSWYRPGHSRLVHRFVYEQINGPIPEGLRVLHTCDNPPCCNPMHLTLGTVAQNQQDMVERGRSKARHWGKGGICVNGHPWDENEYIVRRHRICKTCKADDQRKRRARQKVS
jgi:hypothetical protein